jgi:prepilin-type N-terminal cleavage/methylation domain-containing protein
MNKRGFSLIEMIFAVTFVSVITLFVASQYISGTGIFDEQSKKISLNQDLRHFSDMIADDIKQAIIVENNWTDPLEGTVHQSGNSKIVLALPSVDANGNWLYEGPTLRLDFVVYWIDNNKLWKRVYSNSSTTQRRSLSEKPVLINVKSLSFTYSPHPLAGITRNVDFSLVLSTKSRGKELEVITNKSIKIRNR